MSEPAAAQAAIPASLDDNPFLSELMNLPAVQAVTPKESNGALKNGLRYSHEAMIDVLVSEPWIKQNDLARRFNKTPSWISTIMHSDAFQAAFAARKDAIVDPILRLSVEENTRGLYARSLEVLREKFDKPSEMIPDQLAIQTLAQTARALGYGARQEPTVQVNISNVIESQADNLVKLLRRTKAVVAEEGVIDGEANG